MSIWTLESACDSVDDIVDRFLYVRHSLLEVVHDARVLTWSRWFVRWNCGWLNLTTGELVLHSTDVDADSVHRVVHLSQHGAGEVTATSLQFVYGIL